MKEEQKNKKRDEILNKLNDPKKFRSPYFNPQQVYLREYGITAAMVIKNQNPLAFTFGEPVAQSDDSVSHKDMVDRFAKHIFKQLPVYDWIQAGLDSNTVNAMLKQPLSEDELSLMQVKITTVEFINYYIWYHTENTPATVNSTLIRLCNLHFAAEDFVNTIMPLNKLQQIYAVERLQKAGFGLKELITARQNSSKAVFKPLMIPSQEGGLFGRTYTKSIQVDFARQLLSAGLTPKALHQELKTNELPLSRRFITNINVFYAQVRNALSSSKPSESKTASTIQENGAIKSSEIVHNNDNASLSPTASLSSEGSDASLTSQTSSEGSAPNSPRNSA